jgi:Tfp pilus assembly protein PilX
MNRGGYGGRGGRGFVLIQVLISVMIFSLIASWMMQMVYQTAVASSNYSDSVNKTMQAQGALNQVRAAWASAGICGTSAPVTCTLGTGGCNCTCTITGFTGTITIASSGNISPPLSCALTITSP